MLTFFERSPLDQVLKNDNVHKIQPSFQSPVKISGKSYREGGQVLLLMGVVSQKPFQFSVCVVGTPFYGIQKDSAAEGGR